VALSAKNVFREFIIRGANEIGVIDKLRRFEEYVNSRHGACVDYDVLMHYVDNVFIPILENTNQLAVAVDNNSVPRYYRNRFTKALGTRDKGFIRWFLKNYVMNFTDVDAIVSQNYMALPMFFGDISAFCPAYGSSCVSSPSAVCTPIVILPQTSLCCTSYYINVPSPPSNNRFNAVDNAPWLSNYSSGYYGSTYIFSSSQPTITMTGSFTAPSCFPSSGVTLNLDIIVKPGASSSGSCASSCPSGTICPSVNGCPNLNYCPGKTYNDCEIPVFYYNINLTALPNGSYSTWWQITFS